MADQNTSENSSNKDDSSVLSGGLLTRKPSQKKQKNLVKIFLIVLIIAGVVGGSYYLGYKSGYSKGKEDGVASAKTNVPNLLENIPNIFNSVSGMVEDVSSTSITIKTDSGNKTLELSELIKVNKGEQELSIGDVQKGSEVIIYSTKKDNILTPTRIVIKE